MREIKIRMPEPCLKYGEFAEQIYLIVWGTCQTAKIIRIVTFCCLSTIDLYILVSVRLWKFKDGGS